MSPRGARHKSDGCHKIPTPYAVPCYPHSLVTSYPHNDLSDESPVRLWGRPEAESS